MHEEHYEEPNDTLALKLVDSSVEVVKVSAQRVGRIAGKRLIGDIGLRAFPQLKKAALDLIENRQIDCAWISIPSWYPSLIGNALHRKRIPFGVDYQDPWVHELPIGTSTLSRAAWTIRIARALEPIAVKNASFVTGINAAYFRGCIERNPHLKNKPHGELQLGFSASDHQHLLPNLKQPWRDSERIFIYAGAYLPLSTILWESVFDAMSALKRANNLEDNIRLYLFGTGQSINDGLSSLARAKGVQDHIVEYPQRIPFLHIQEFMRRAEGVLSIGSTEAHYSASKTFQCILSRKKIFSLCHHESEAPSILKRCHADAYHVDFKAEQKANDRIEKTMSALQNYFAADANSWKLSLALDNLSPYSATQSAQKLVNTIEQISSKR